MRQLLPQIGAAASGARDVETGGVPNSAPSSYSRITGTSRATSASASANGQEASQTRRPSVSTPTSRATSASANGQEASQTASSGARSHGVGMYAPPRAPFRATAAAAKGRSAENNRQRAEIYAINAFLRTLEQEKFQQFLAEMTVLDKLDNVTWCSDESSAMPSPQYRTEKEKRETSSTTARTATVRKEAGAACRSFGGV